jgi:hypothetical protein
MEVINNATEVVSPLTQMRGHKEELLAQLDKENARTQNIIRKQNSKRQEVMIYCVLGAFCALCSCLICMAKDTIFHSVYIPFSIVMTILALFFLFMAIRSYPASVKYHATWKNFKKAPTYEDVLKDSLENRKKTREVINSLNSQLDRLDNRLAKKTIPDERNSN